MGLSPMEGAHKGIPGLDGKLDDLALFLVFFAPVMTALPLYPFLAMIAWRQARPDFVRSLPKNQLSAVECYTGFYPTPQCSRTEPFTRAERDVPGPEQA